MLQLTEDLFLATGRRRNCYRHPDDPGKCVKVSHLTRGRDMQARREARYYGKYAKQGCSLDHLATFHGQVQTNLGSGTVFSLITNPDGELSSSLLDYVLGGTLVEEFEADFKKLRDYMFKEAIIVGDFNPTNILVHKQKDGSRHLVIVDGVGNSDFFKLADYSKIVRDKKIRRKWDRLLRRLRRCEKMFRAKTNSGGSPISHATPTSRPSVNKEHSPRGKATIQQ